MMRKRIKITHKDGTVTYDSAFGNTKRALNTAVAALTRSYQLEGATVEVVKGKV